MHFLLVVKQLEDKWIAGLQADIAWYSGIQRSDLTIGFGQSWQTSELGVTILTPIHGRTFVAQINEEALQRLRCY